MHWALVGRPGVLPSTKEALLRRALRAMGWPAVVKGAIRLQMSERGWPMVAYT